MRKCKKVMTIEQIQKNFDSVLTEVQAGRMLKIEAVARITGIAISYSHLFNHAQFPVLEKKQAQLITSVARASQVGEYQLLSRDRSGRVGEARQICFYLMRNKQGLSTIEIGKIFNRSHATVLYGLNRIKGFLSINEPSIERLLNDSVKNYTEVKL